MEKSIVYTGGCIDCNNYSKELDGPRKCLINNDEVMHDWWELNKHNKRPNITSVYCFERTNIAKRFDSLLEDAKEVLQLLRNR
jgi:hypothetical protein